MANGTFGPSPVNHHNNSTQLKCGTAMGGCSMYVPNITKKLLANKKPSVINHSSDKPTSTRTTMRTADILL